jgi:hypothetical protein
MNIPKRTQKSLNGLLQMICYLGQKIDIKNTRMVEIGSWVGSSACLFAKHFKEVICIDPFLPLKNTITERHDMTVVYKTFLNNIKPHKNIHHIKHKSEDFLKDVDDIDIIYIDGSHHYEDVKADILLSIPKVKKYITGHDYWPKKFPGVIKAVNETIGKPDKTFPDTSWIKKVG